VRAFYFKSFFLKRSTDNALSSSWFIFYVLCISWVLLCCRYDVLLEFYQQCGGASWQKSKGWSLATRPVSDWTGITVVTETLKVTESEHASANSEPPLRNKVLRVSGVNLGRNSLSGSQIPWEALSELQLLSSLDLSHNNLSGGFPMSFPLQRCTKLDLSFNKLTGPLPPAFITPMPCLEVLCLSSNALTGEGPWEALQKMPALKLLALDCNDFNGPIPTAFDGCVLFDVLYILIQLNIRFFLFQWCA